MLKDRVIIEGDAQIVADAINASLSHSSVFDDFVKVWKLIISSLSNCSISFARRSAHVWHMNLLRLLDFARALILVTIYLIMWLGFQIFRACVSFKSDIIIFQKKKKTNIVKKYTQNIKKFYGKINLEYTSIFLWHIYNMNCWNSCKLSISYKCM